MWTLLEYNTLKQKLVFNVNEKRVYNFWEG